ncbi:MAG: HAD family phosphatase [Ruminococcus sp.]|nr:HAD family phosphatase [Ruminococcus sp.]
MKYKGIIFDLDGTLLDSMSVWENVDRDFLLENNAVYTTDVSDVVKKMTIQQSAEYFRTQFNLPHSCEYIINRIEEMVSEQYCRHIPLKKGVYEALKKLLESGIKMCVATATYNSLVNAALKRLGIYDMFEFVLTCSDVGSGKDKPDIFYKAAEKLLCDTSEVIVVEDSLHCIETAKKAGFFTIAVYDEIARNDRAKILEISDCCINDMSEFCEIFFNLNEV